MAVRHLINEPFALWRPAIVSGHLGGGGGFVDEDKSLRIEARLLFAQGLTGRDDVFPILLGGADALFLNASLRWRRKRKIADWLTFTFFFAKRALSSASVLSAVPLRAS
jgi:hypothetical protein